MVVRGEGLGGEVGAATEGRVVQDSMVIGPFCNLIMVGGGYIELHM